MEADPSKRRARMRAHQPGALRACAELKSIFGSSIIANRDPGGLKENKMAGNAGNDPSGTGQAAGAEGAQAGGQQNNTTPKAGEGAGQAGAGDKGGGGNPAEKSGAPKGNESDKVDLKSLPEPIQKMIKELRKESGDNRVKAKTAEERLAAVTKLLSGEDENQDPVEVAQTLQGQLEQVGVENAILQAAYENGIPHDQYDFFKFLVSQEAGKLEEGAELDLEPILAKIPGRATATPATTGVDKGAPGKAGGTNGINLEQFKAMGPTQKAQLRRDNPSVYDTLSQSLRASYDA
jgi:hypothetical protein